MSIDVCRPGPGYHDPDLGLFGAAPLGRGAAHPAELKLRRKDVMRSSYSLVDEKTATTREIKGSWGNTAYRKQESRDMNYSSACSFPKKSPEKRRATGKNMQSTVQNMKYHFHGRQSPGALRFSAKKYH